MSFYNFSNMKFIGSI